MDEHQASRFAETKGGVSQKLTIDLNSTNKAIYMAENKKERIEMLRKELKIRRGLAECNARFAIEIKKELKALEGD